MSGEEDVQGKKSALTFSVSNSRSSEEENIDAMKTNNAWESSIMVQETQRDDEKKYQYEKITNQIELENKTKPNEK